MGLNFILNNLYTEKKNYNFAFAKEILSFLIHFSTNNVPFLFFNFSIGTIFPKRFGVTGSLPHCKQYLLVDDNTTGVPEQRTSDKHNHYWLVITDMLGFLSTRDKDVTKHHHSHSHSHLLIFSSSHRS